MIAERAMPVGLDERVQAWDCGKGSLEAEKYSLNRYGGFDYVVDSSSANEEAGEGEIEADGSRSS